MKTLAINSLTLPSFLHRQLKFIFFISVWLCSLVTLQQKEKVNENFRPVTLMKINTYMHLLIMQVQVLKIKQSTYQSCNNVIHVHTPRALIILLKYVNYQEFTKIQNGRCCTYLSFQSGLTLIGDNFLNKCMHP